MVVVAGFDEAGRGPVLGPLVVCGVSVDEEILAELALAGVKDSKRLSPKKRAALAQLVREQSIQCVVEVVSPRKIDALRSRGVSLNLIEARAFAKLVGKIHADAYFMDAADVNAARFGRLVMKMAGKPAAACFSEHRADDSHVVVGASSIVAKVERDAHVARLAELHGDVGSGYPSDPRTKRFLESYYLEHRSFPDFVRTSWATCAALVAKHTAKPLEKALK
ncbi:MAG: ribonuclease HII [Promethearchaeota archaeon]